MEFEDFEFLGKDGKVIEQNWIDLADAKADEKREKDGEAMLAQEEYYPIDFDDMEAI